MIGNALLNTSGYEVNTGGGFEYLSEQFLLKNFPITSTSFTQIPLNSRIFIKKIVVYSNVHRPEWQYAYVDIVTYGRVVDQMTLPPANTILFQRENFFHDIKSVHFGINGAFRIGYSGSFPNIKPIYSSYYADGKTFFSCDMEIYYN